MKKVELCTGKSCRRRDGNTFALERTTCLQSLVDYQVSNLISREKFTLLGAKYYYYPVFFHLSVETIMVILKCFN